MISPGECASRPGPDGETLARLEEALDQPPTERDRHFILPGTRVTPPPLLITRQKRVL